MRLPFHAAEGRPLPVMTRGAGLEDRARGPPCRGRWDPGCWGWESGPEGGVEGDRGGYVTEARQEVGQAAGRGCPRRAAEAGLGESLPMGQDQVS